jgi:hypothetical protein
MASEQSRKTRKNRWLLAIGLLLAVGVASGLAVFVAAPADAQTSRGTSSHGFKSGSERSLVILGEIRDTLRQIDTRLQKIERAVTKTANREPNVQHTRPAYAR